MGNETRKKKILIIDDELDFLDLLKSQLDLEGYSVVTACDGNKALEEVEKDMPDLVICDIKMPGKNGHEVLTELRKGKYHGPFIMLSALDDFDNVKQAYHEDADFYIAKPVQLAILLKNIHTLLSLSQQKKE